MNSHVFFTYDILPKLFPNSFFFFFMKDGTHIDMLGKQIPSIHKNLLEWFREAQVKCFVEKTDGFSHFKFTKKGYEKAMSYDQPIQYFYKKHWKWLLPTIFTVIGALAGILGSIFVMLQYFDN